MNNFRENNDHEKKIYKKLKNKKNKKITKCDDSNSNNGSAIVKSSLHI